MPARNDRRSAKSGNPNGPVSVDWAILTPPLIGHDWIDIRHPRASGNSFLHTHHALHTVCSIHIRVFLVPFSVSSISAECKVRLIWLMLSGLVIWQVLARYDSPSTSAWVSESICLCAACDSVYPGLWVLGQMRHDRMVWQWLRSSCLWIAFTWMFVIFIPATMLSSSPWLGAVYENTIQLYTQNNESELVGSSVSRSTDPCWKQRHLTPREFGQK